MAVYRLHYPGIPVDTAHAAKSLYGSGNIYLRLGDHLDSILEGLIPVDHNTSGVANAALEQIILLVLLTIFQYVEELDNNSMVRTLSNRFDLRYALHLPLKSPGLSPDFLCNFRKRIFGDPAKMQILQGMLERLRKFGLLTQPKDQTMDAFQLLTAVCSVNRFCEVVDAMHRALEALAVANPEWLRQVTLPYWYDRYNRNRRENLHPSTDQEWMNRATQIAEDIYYLLGEIDQSHDAGLNTLLEIQEIRRVWNEQFYINPQGGDQKRKFLWRLTRCATCDMH